MDDTREFGQVGVALPGKITDGTTGVMRLARYGEVASTVNGKSRYANAEEGTYFVATNPTPGTAIAGVAGAATADDTKTLFLLRNNDAAGGKSIYLDRLQLLVNTAGTNGTNVRYMTKLDFGNTRYTSGGSAITPVNPNGNGSNSNTISICRFGALVTAAATTAARLLGNGQVRSVITVVQDVYTWDFGGEVQNPAALITTGTAVSHVVLSHVPVIIGPQQEFLFCLYAASQTVASQFEFAASWWER